MADKEATVFVVDLGRSMGAKHHGRSESDLDWSLQFLWDKVTNIVSTGRKGLMVGVLGLRTDDTENSMSADPSYSNICELQPISQILMPELQRMPKVLKASETDDGDALSGVILAVDMIMKFCRHLKYTKKVFLITNGTGLIDADDIESTAKQIAGNSIELTVLGVDFDDPEYGFKEEDKSPSKAQNEQTLKELVELCNGVYGTMAEAIEMLARPHVKAVRPTPTYRGLLSLGDTRNYDTAIAIDVERYFKVSIRRPPTASSFVQKDGSSQIDDDRLANVRNSYLYSIKDEDTTTGRRDIPREELAKGYEYGRTAVHISESDENITKLETDMGYEILGFIPAENVERYMLLDNSNVLVAQKGNDKAIFALSSLVHALFELGSCAVARFVKKDMAEPQLTLLSPLINEEIECLIENILPFAEDLRQYRFPPLDKILTVSGKTLTSHRNLPSDKLLDAMSKYVDDMKLTTGPDQDETMDLDSNEDATEGEERIAIEDTFSPILHTIEGAIKHRALRPHEPIPPTPERLLQPSQPPSDLKAQSRDSLQRLIKEADVKKVPPKTKGRRKYREAEKPISGLDVNALLNKPSSSTSNSQSKSRRVQISPDNPIPEFKRALASAEDMAVIRDAAKQMTAIIEDQIKTSFGDQNYARVIEELGVVRQELLELEEPKLYNDLLRRLKTKIYEGEELGVNRKQLWWNIRQDMSVLGLIDRNHAESSDVSKEEALEFMASTTKRT